MRQPATRFALLSFVLLVFALPAYAQEDLDARLKEIDEYAAKAGRDWKAPGFSVAIVKDDRVVFVKGYGVRELGKPDAVDADTIFAIGSNTKAFTSAALAVLVDEGKVSWDDPVTKHLPGFQLFDPYATREMSVRDLLSHRSGLATFAGDLLWYESSYGRDEIIRRARHLRPASSFRSRFGYQNIMFLAAGEIVPAVAGKSWDDFLKEKFFDPLGMRRTLTRHADFARASNVAAPHNEVDSRLRSIPHGNVDNVGGAGAIKSSAADMAQWVRLQLARGTRDGRKIFGTAASREMWTPHAVLGAVSESAEKFNPTTHFGLYGLGWILNDYQGRLLVSHGGGLDGMISRVALMPEERLGLVVLTNSETSLSSALSNKILDVFLGVARRDWSADFLARTKQAKETSEAAARKVEDARVPNTKPSLSLESYAGVYTGEMFGDARVTAEGGRLVLRLLPSPKFVGDLEHWHFDTFRVRWREGVVYPFPRGFVTFTLDAQGKPAELKLDVPNFDFDFKEIELRRAPDAQTPRSN
ncbi:MAG TPA: serine hydrolase [Pyrinomonadaceae bacterium]